MKKKLLYLLFIFIWWYAPLTIAIPGGIGSDIGKLSLNQKNIKEIAPEPTQWLFRPKLVTGVAHLKYEESDTKFKWSDNLPLIGIGGGMHYGKLYAELYAQLSDKGQDDGFTTLTSSNSNANSDANTTTNTVHDADFRRTEYSALLNYEPIKGVSLFGGYKIAELEIDRKESGQAISEVTIKATEKTTEKTTTIKGDLITKLIKTNFKTKGPFLGIAYNYAINDDMKLAASFAYGWLDGTRNVTTIYNLTQEVTEDSPDTSPTTAQAYGISFIHRLPRHSLKYVLALENYAYKMDLEELVVDVKGSVLRVNKFSVKESMLGFKVSLIWEF